MGTYLIRIGAVLLWGSLVFIPRKSIKRFMPVTILSSLITMTGTFIGLNYNLWEIKGNARRKLWNALTLVLGLFPLGNIWIYHLTYGNFRRYVLANLLNNIIYGLPIITFLEKMNFIKYTKFSRFHHIVVAMIYSTILYGYQNLYDHSEK
ncbi:hypothetical protein SAMN05421676_10712 [Salinibacillus kushneri]|uniref:Uncharacterized protein n=1 Tax=Salinibacillus kushneri TaxID=237682 RepID=A0A1I0GK56_9BACI|nr:hypothetical protein [Salinibacillus kushneri]SET70755.1 hypothetical protein SAMN05421676_10712 [Salinibacillus kushneri]